MKKIISEPKIEQLSHLSKLCQSALKPTSQTPSSSGDGNSGKGGKEMSKKNLIKSLGLKPSDLNKNKTVNPEGRAMPAKPIPTKMKLKTAPPKSGKKGK